MRYVALLRGINIGGHNVKMTHLRELFSELGLADVATYIQSGNVFFTVPEAGRAGGGKALPRAHEALQSLVEEHLAERLGYRAPTFLRTVPELGETLAAVPALFREEAPGPERRYLVQFSSQGPPPDVSFPLLSPKGGYEVLGTAPGALFVVWHVPAVRAEDPNFLDKKLGMTTTARFYHTAQKILAAATATAPLR
jgi:uncharacterized protein (DUF1697 family)